MSFQFVRRTVALALVSGAIVFGLATGHVNVARAEPGMPGDMLRPGPGQVLLLGGHVHLVVDGQVFNYSMLRVITPETYSPGVARVYGFDTVTVADVVSQDNVARYCMKYRAGYQGKPWESEGWLNLWGERPEQFC